MKAGYVNLSRRPHSLFSSSSTDSLNILSISWFPPLFLILSFSQGRRPYSRPFSPPFAFSLLLFSRGCCRPKLGKSRATPPALLLIGNWLKWTERSLLHKKQLYMTARSECGVLMHRKGSFHGCFFPGIFISIPASISFMHLVYSCCLFLFFFYFCRLSKASILVSGLNGTSIEVIFVLSLYGKCWRIVNWSCWFRWLFFHSFSDHFLFLIQLLLHWMIWVFFY